MLPAAHGDAPQVAHRVQHQDPRGNSPSGGGGGGGESQTAAAVSVPVPVARSQPRDVPGAHPRAQALRQRPPRAVRKLPEGTKHSTGTVSSHGLWRPG